MNLTKNQEATLNLYKIYKKEIQEYVTHRISKLNHTRSIFKQDADSYYTRSLIYDKDIKLKKILREANISVQALDQAAIHVSRNLESPRYVIGDNFTKYNSHISTLYAIRGAIEFIQETRKKPMYVNRSCPAEKFPDFQKKVFELSFRKTNSQLRGSYARKLRATVELIKENEVMSVYMDHHMKDDPVVFEDDSAAAFIKRTIDRFNYSFDAARKLKELAKKQNRKLGENENFETILKAGKEYDKMIVKNYENINNTKFVKDPTRTKKILSDVYRILKYGEVI